MRLAGQGALDDIGLQAVDNGGDVTTTSFISGFSSNAFFTLEG
jgi:hypothetical protein